MPYEELRRCPQCGAQVPMERGQVTCSRSCAMRRRYATMTPAQRSERARRAGRASGKRRLHKVFCRWQKEIATLGPGYACRRAYLTGYNTGRKARRYYEAAECSMRREIRQRYAAANALQWIARFIVQHPNYYTAHEQVVLFHLAGMMRGEPAGFHGRIAMPTLAGRTGMRPRGLRRILGRLVLVYPRVLEVDTQPWREHGAKSWHGALMRFRGAAYVDRQRAFRPAATETPLVSTRAPA